MPKYDKPSDINFVWASQALSGDIASPDSNGDITGEGGTYNIFDGWDQSKPPYEIENYSMNRLYQGLAYYNQLGFPEWDADTEYQAGKSYVQGSNNVVYKCVQTHINKNPATAGNEAFWNVWEGNRQATQTSRGTTQYATDNQAKSGVVDNVAVTPANLLGGLLGTADLSANGNVKIPVNFGGVRKDFIVQWMTLNHQTQGEVFNFTQAFPNQCFAVFPVDDANSSGSVRGIGITNVTKTNFEVYSARVSTGGVDAALQFQILAIGY